MFTICIIGSPVCYLTLFTRFTRYEFTVIHWDSLIYCTVYLQRIQFTSSPKYLSVCLSVCYSLYLVSVSYVLRCWVISPPEKRAVVRFMAGKYVQVGGGQRGGQPRPYRPRKIHIIGHFKLQVYKETSIPLNCQGWTEGFFYKCNFTNFGKTSGFHLKIVPLTVLTAGTVFQKWI